MRPQQQNRRMRGRNNNGGGGNNNNNNNNNNNRKGPNPLTRNYESNGPDVKIRGSAQQIAEKYAQLARDSHSSGDRVMAENYLQHAEHYNRIIAAAQAQMPIQNVQNNRDMADDDMEDERDEFDAIGGNGNQGNNNYGNGNQNAGSQNHGNQSHGGNGNNLSEQPQPPSFSSEQPQPRSFEAAPQPVIEGTPAEVALNPEARGEGVSRRGRNPGGRGGHQPRTPAPLAPVEAASVPEIQAAPQVPAEAAESDAAPRRGRRPRRGERARPDGDEDVGVEGLVQTLSRGVSPEAAAKEPSGGPALVDVDN